MKFYAETNGKQTKKFEATNVNVIYNQFNKYCKSRLGMDAALVVDPTSFGQVHWSNGEKIIKLIKDPG